jgi:multiple sugar transport system permease protein
MLSRLPVRGALAAAAAALFLAPVWLMLSGGLRAPGAALGSAWWPTEWSLEGLRAAFTLVPLWSGLGNSLLVLLAAVPITLLTASGAGLALALAPRAQQPRLIAALLLLAAVPLTAVWVPRFTLFHALGLSDGLLPVIAPSLMAGAPLYVLLYFLAFRRIPETLFEAARLEGLSWWALWWNVALPLTRPTTVAVGVLAGAQFWNNFMDALLYLHRTADQTAPQLLHALDLLGSTNWPVLMAGAAAVTLPVIVAFLLAHRHFEAPERGSAWLGR